MLTTMHYKCQYATEKIFLLNLLDQNHLKAKITALS